MPSFTHDFDKLQVHNFNLLLMFLFIRYLDSRNISQNEKQVHIRYYSVNNNHRHPWPPISESHTGLSFAAYDNSTTSN